MFLVKQTHAGPEWHPWIPNHAYRVGDLVGIEPAPGEEPNPVIFRCTSPGNSGDKPPEWPKATHKVDTFVDDPEEPHVMRDVRMRLPPIGDGGVTWVASKLHHDCSLCEKHLSHGEDIHHEAPVIHGFAKASLVLVTATLCDACAAAVHERGGHVALTADEMEKLALSPRGSRERTKAIADRVRAEQHAGERARVAVIMSRAERALPVTT